ncbi:MAG: hypothetical protein ACJ72A_24145 [Nocardioidaceae bacterium]|jgi:hypothetical protein
MRSFLAGLAVLLGGVIGTAALGAFVVHQTVLDPDRAGDVLASALQRPDLRQTILARTVPGYRRLPREGRSALDQLAQTSQVESVLRSVRLTDNGEVRLAPLRSQLTQALRDNGQSQLAARVASGGGPDVVSVPTDLLDRYTTARDTTWLVATRGALVAVALFLVALLVSRNRAGTVRAVGLTILLGCAVVALVYWVSPNLAHAASSNPWVESAGAVRDSQRSTVVTILVPVAAVGVVLLIASLLIPKATRHHSEDYR